MKYSVRFSFFLFLFLFVLGIGDAFAASAADSKDLTLDPNSWQASWSAGALMLALLFTAFFG